MNINDIAGQLITSVSPDITASLQRSTGYTTAPDGTRQPSYAAPVSVLIQIQALQYNDLVAIDGLNIQGTRRKGYIDGEWAGLIRADGRGGDLLTFSETPGGASKVWLVAYVFEQWQDWCSVCLTMQDNA